MHLSRKPTRHADVPADMPPVPTCRRCASPRRFSTSTFTLSGASTLEAALTAMHSKQLRTAWQVWLCSAAALPPEQR